jgi:hypothetical protein
MKKIETTIEGISPLLMHKYPMKDTDAKSKAKNQKQTEDDVESYLYLDHNKKLAQPSIHLISSLKKAGAKYQIPGQGKLTYKNLMGSGAVIIDPDMIPHIHQKWEIDRRPVVVQRSRIVRSRPVLNKWKLEFAIEYDDEEIAVETLKELLDFAGRRVGIGDFRPEKGGSFGRFIVARFE